MPEEMVRDYSSYVMAVFAIATVVYGGVTLLWQRQAKETERLLKEAEAAHESPRQE